MKIVSLVSSLFTLSSITANDISTYFTLAFFAILLLLIIGFLIGLWRGMWNSGFRLIFIGILVAGAFLFTRNIADWLASLDIKAIMSNFGVNLSDVSFNMNETTTITVEITNIKDMIISAVGQVYEAVGLGSASSTQAIELITGLTMVLLRYVTFIIEVLLIVILGEPLAAFFYHVIFKWLLPRNVRKHMKVRLAGGFMNMVKVGLVGAMFLIPFSSLLNTINQAVHDPDTATAEGVDSATYNQIMGFLDAYNDSPFAQVLFNWSVNEDGKTLDVVLMDYLTAEDMGDVQLSLTTELYTIAGIGKTILSTGIAEGGTDALLTQLLSNENLIASLFVDIANSGLIMKAIPIALAVAMNMDVVQDYVDPDLLNFDEVNWHEELLNLGDIADQVVASGVVTDVMNADDATMVPTILNSLANPEKYPAIRQALADIDNSDFLAQVVPAVLYKLASDDVGSDTTLTVSDFLPADWADYQDLHIGEELTLFYDCFYNMANDIDATFLPTLIDVITSGGGAGSSSAVTPRVLGAQSNQTPGENQHATRPVSYVAGTGTMTDLIDIIRAHVDEFIAILVGNLNSSGEPTGITSDGKTDLTVAGAKPCMLDSTLLLYGMGNVLNFGLTAMMDSLTAGTGVTVDPSTITVAVEELQGADMAERRVNYKREYGSLLEIVGAAIQNDAIAELIGAATASSSSSSAAVNPDTLHNDITPLRADSSSATSSENVFMDLINNEEVRDLIKNEICPLLDRSVLMNAILPSVLESLISSASLTDTLDLVGLTPADFNFENLEIGTEIANFVDLAGYAMNLTDITGPDAINAIADHSADIVGVLDCIYNSNIINPKDSLGHFASDNYYKLLEAVFGQVSDLGVNTDDIAAAIESVPEDAWLTTYDGLGNVIAYGENYRMIDTIVTAVNSGLFDLMDSSNILADLNAPAYDGAISSIFAAVDRSTVMSGCFGSILDSLFGGTGGLLDPTGTGTSFRNVTDWTAEGENLEFLIHSLADFGSDINSIDFMNSDPVLINNLLQGLAASQIFDKPDGTYLFNEFLFEKLIATDFKTYLYDKDETDLSFVGASAFDVAKADFDSIGQTTSAADKLAWSEEIERLCDLINEVKIFTDAHGGTDAFASLTDGSATAADIEPIILAANNCTILHMVIYNVFDSMLGGGAMDMGDLNPADANTAALITMTKEERDTEIGLTLDIYGSIQTLGIDTGFTADKIDSAIIGSMLTNLHASLIFNTIKSENSRAAGDLTIFEQTVKMIFTTSTIDTYIYPTATDETRPGLLEDTIFGIGNNLAGTTQDPDGWIGVNGEIAHLVNIMETYKATEIDFTDLGSDAGTVVTDLMSTPEGKAKVENMLIAINHSLIAYPAIPNLFDELLNAGSFVMGDLNPADSNTAILLTLDVDGRDEEISNILDIHGAIQDLGLDTGFTADKIDSVKISDLLTMLHDSKVFNTLKADKDRLAADLTVFEQTVKMVFTTSQIDTYVYKKFAEPLHSGMLSADLIAIGNNFAGTTLDADGWLGVNGEIASLANIMETYKATAIDFTDLGTDAGATVTALMATPEGKTKIENMLIAINHDAIAYPAIPNLFDDVLGTSDFDMGDLHPADSNTAILMDLDVNERDTEIIGILDIHTAIQDLGIDTGFTADKIDSVKIGDLLTMLHDSKVFNTIKAENDRLAGDLTVFEQTAKMIYTTSQLDTYIYKKFAVELHDGMLTDDLIGIGNDMAGTEPDVDGWIGLGGQIAKIVNIMETYKETAIDFTDLGTDGGGTVTTLMATPEGTVKVQNMLIAINHDAIAYPAIPNLFDDVLGTGDFTMGDLDPADANTAIMLTLDVTTRDAEIINVLDIHDSIKGLGLDTGFTADKIDGAAIETLLTQLHDSNIFNTIKAEKSRVLDDLTVFEQTYKMIITNSTMDGYIYKLYALALRSGLLSEDIITIGNDMYGNNAEVDGWMGAGNELERLIDILDAFKATAIDFTDFGTNGAETVSGLMDTPEGTTKVENLLLSMNHSSIVYPAIPNLFDTMLTASDVTMTGVDMATANTHYTGDRFMTPYDDSEISQVMVIYGDMKNISSLDYSDLSLLSNTDIDSAETLLNDFEQSKIFHLEGAASGIDADPTVFEQMMVKIMDDTGLSTQISDTLNPNPAYYDGLVYKFASAHEKALYIVTNYDTLYTAGDFFTDSWEGTGGEIESFLRIFRELKRIIPTMTTTTIDTSGLTPENISDILAVLNYSNLGSDAVPKLVRDTFTTMSIGTYTEGNEEYYLSVMDYDDTELDQKDYTDYPTEDPTTTKTGLLHVMLNGFWDESVDPDAYIDMSGAFSLADYINGGKSTKNLMQFLEGSQILAPVVEDDDVSIFYETRSLMFYNLLDNVDMTKYIRPLVGGTKSTRSTQLEDIFTGDFDYVMEGNGLDALIVDLINLTTISDTTSLEGQGAAAAGLIESTYLATGDTITDRAYMSSELTAGFYTDVLEDDYTLAEANLGHAVTVIDFYATDFEQLCPREAKGTEAVLSIIPEINAIVAAPTTQAEVDELRASFVDMGSVAACTAPGPVWFDGNSNIAQLIYASRVISNANFTAAVAAMAFGFPPVIVEDDPYVNGFVFETEGNKVCDYFETFI